MISRIERDADPTLKLCRAVAKQTVLPNINTENNPERQMTIFEIKSLLTAGDIPANKINPIIKALKEEDLESLSQLERESLREVISGMLLLIQHPNNGAYLDDPEKAELLLSAMS